MTVDDLLALAARVPPSVRRLEFEDDGTSGLPRLGRIVIETAPVLVPLPPAPAAKEPPPKRSDVSSLGHAPAFPED